MPAEDHLETEDIYALRHNCLKLLHCRTALRHDHRPAHDKHRSIIFIILTLIQIQCDHAFRILIRGIAYGSPHHIPVSLIKELRLHHGKHHLTGHKHLPAQDIVPHGPVMGEQ